MKPFTGSYRVHLTEVTVTTKAPAVDIRAKMVITNEKMHPKAWTELRPITKEVLEKFNAFREALEEEAARMLGADVPGEVTITDSTTSTASDPPAGIGEQLGLDAPQL